MKNIQSEFISFRTSREQKLRMIDYCKQNDKKVSELMRQFCEQLFGSLTLGQSDDQTSSASTTMKGSQAWRWQASLLGWTWRKWQSRYHQDQRSQQQSRSRMQRTHQRQSTRSKRQWTTAKDQFWCWRSGYDYKLTN